jgi:hypothetical protein
MQHESRSAHHPGGRDHSLYRPGIDNAACRAGRLEVVAEAENGIGAMTAAHTSQPDVVLTDLNMPGLTGSSRSPPDLHGARTWYETGRRPQHAEAESLRLHYEQPDPGSEGAS